MKSRVITLTDKLEYLIDALGEASGHDSAIICTKAQNGENIAIWVNTFSYKSVKIDGKSTCKAIYLIS